MACLKIDMFKNHVALHGATSALENNRGNDKAQRPKMTQAEKANRLLELHHGASPLVLINAWDAASAAMVEHCGLPAVATSSAAVANALGYPDGQYVPWPEMLAAISRIARAVSVPVTADIEAGFAADAHDLKQLESAIEQAIDAGAVGANLEDSLPAHADPNVRHSSPLYPLA